MHQLGQAHVDLIDTTLEDRLRLNQRYRGRCSRRQVSTQRRRDERVRRGPGGRDGDAWKGLHGSGSLNAPWKFVRPLELHLDLIGKRLVTLIKLLRRIHHKTVALR